MTMIDSHHIPYRNFGDFFAATIGRYAGKSFMGHVNGECDFTYSQFGERVEFAASRLLEHGLFPGERVVLYLSSGSGFFAAFCATLLAGGVPVLCNPTYTVTELTDVVRRTAARFVTAAEPLEGAGIPLVLPAEMFLDGQPIGIPSAWPERSLEDSAYIIFSAGSTAQPKGCVISHRNLLAELFSMERAYALPNECVHLCVLPMFHASALFRNLLIPFSQGTRIIVAPAFDVERFWKWIGEFNVGFVQLVPAILRALVESGIEPSTGVLASLHYVGSASAPLPVALLERFEERFGVRVGQGYGQTEATCGICFNDPRIASRPLGSVGRAIDVAELKIVDDAGRELPVGITGNIVVSGALVMQDYLDGVDLTGRPIDGNVLHTGDIGSLDANGYLFIEGRKSDMIARAGFKVSPKEVETALMELPGITEAVVFGVSQDMLGEDIIAYVRSMSGTLNETGLRRALKVNLAPYKIPSRIFLMQDSYSEKDFKISRAMYRRRYLDDRAQMTEKTCGGTARIAERRSNPEKPRAFLWDEAVYLRPLMESDLQSKIYLDNIMDPGVQFYTYSGRFPQSEWMIRDYWTGVKAPDHLVFAICDMETDQYVGNIALRIDWVARIAEFGRMIFRQYQRGPWSEHALRLVIGYAFEELKLTRLWGGGANPASVPSLLKLGFTLEGSLRRHHFLRGEWRDQFMVGMLDSDWVGIKNGRRPESTGALEPTYSPDLLRQIIELVADCFDMDPAELDAKSGPEIIPGWDSLGTVLLWNFLEERFRVLITSSDMISFTNLGGMAVMLARKLST